MQMGLDAFAGFRSVLIAMVMFVSGQLQGAESPPDGPLAVVSVTASSTETPTKDARHLVDGSGLTESPAGSGAFLHTSNPYRFGGKEQGTMWDSGYTKPTRDRFPTVVFDLGKSVSIGSVRIWNYNEKSPFNDRGFKVVEFASSEDGTTYHLQGVTRLERAPGEPEYAGQVVSFKTAFSARYVRFTCKANYGGDLCGLSEVRFFRTGAGAAGALTPTSQPEPEKPAGYPVKSKPNPPRPAVAGAENIVFPSDSGIVDVTAAPYNAKGDGVTDDTAAIQQALNDWPASHAIIYLPNGTYRISDTLKWPHGWRGGMEEKDLILQGQSAAGTILQLPDSAAGFADPTKPKAMIWTGQSPAQRFRNSIRNVTFDVSRGNAGAIGVRFMANNQGTLRDVAIRSGDGKGVIGLDMGYTNEIGPLLVKNVSITGFDIGIQCKNAINSQTLEQIVLEKQNVCGLVSEGQILAIRELRSNNAVPAVRSGPGHAMLVLIDSQLSRTGEASKLPAIQNSGTAFVRNLLTSGYARAIEGNAAPDGANVSEWVSHPALTLFDGTPTRSLNLPVRPTPEVPWDDLKDWASPAHFGAVPYSRDDASEAIQKAIDSGKSTVYLPHGRYRIDRTVLIRGNVRRLIGCEATIEVGKMEGPVFKVVEGAAPVVVVERLAGGFLKTPFFDNASARTLVIRHCCNVNGHFSGSGDLFIEDVCSNPYTNWVFKGQKVWARQFNVENEGTHVINDGATLWILGYKTERGGTLIETRNGGATEVLGGFTYTTTKGKLAPMFTVTDSDFSAVFGETFFNFKDSPFVELVKETRGAQTRVLKKGQAPGRVNGSKLPLFVASKTPTSPK